MSDTENSPAVDPNLKYKVLEFRLSGTPDTQIEVYLLNPGNHFDRFGGSRQGLVVRKTASLIVRTHSMGLRDVEYDLGDEVMWGYIRMWIAQGYGVEFNPVNADR